MLRDVKLGSYYFNPITFLSALSGGAFLAAWAMMGPRWAIVGAFICAFIGAFAQSLTSQRAPAWSVKQQAPVTNGDGKPTGQIVATIPDPDPDHAAN